MATLVNYTRKSFIESTRVGFTCQHKQQRVEEHKYSSSSTGKHFCDKHCQIPKDLSKKFSILKKCKNKFDCLLFEMFFFIKELRPSLNVQSDSIRAKVFTSFFIYFSCIPFILHLLTYFYNRCITVLFSFYINVYIYIYIYIYYICTCICI